MRIIPSINTETFKEAREKINLLKDLTKEFHIDIASVDFCNYQSWGNPVDFEKLDENLQFGIHLMLNLKPQEILKWSNKRIKRFILHLEGTNNPDGLLKIAKRTNKEIYVALSPKTEIEMVEVYIPHIDGILVLGVEPGASGQEMLGNTFKKMQEARNKLQKNQKIMVDGGINENNIQKIIEYKPDFIILGSAIYNSENPRESYQKFSKMVV